MRIRFWVLVRGVFGLIVGIEGRGLRFLRVGGIRVIFFVFVLVGW